MLLDVSVSIDGEKVVLEGLEKYSQGIEARAIPKALRKIASGTAREALHLLTGPKVGLKTITAAKSGRQRSVPKHNDYAGAYPVPRVSGNLRRLLSWIGPNTSKEGFSTGPFEATLYDSAEYAKTIHEGTGTSEMYGPRPFLDDALKAFNGRAWNNQDRITRTIEEEIARVRNESGLE